MTGVDEESGPLWGAGFLSKLFFESYSEGISLGEIFTDAISSYYSYYQMNDPVTPQEFILIGDPSLKIGGCTK